MFIQIKNDEPYGYPVVYDNMRQLIPFNVSLPSFPLTKDLLPFGFAIYEFSAPPYVSPADFKVVEEDNPVWSQDEIRGAFVKQTWKIRDMTEEEKAATILQKWQEIRAIRDDKLLRSDWTQIPNTPITEEKKQEWFVYRQELRDITNQTDPFNIVWPIEP